MAALPFSGELAANGASVCRRHETGERHPAQREHLHVGVIPGCVPCSIADCTALISALHSTCTRVVMVQGAHGLLHRLASSSTVNSIDLTPFASRAPQAEGSRDVVVKCSGNCTRGVPGDFEQVLRLWSR